MYKVSEQLPKLENNFKWVDVLITFDEHTELHQAVFGDDGAFRFSCKEDEPVLSDVKECSECDLLESIV